MNPTLWKIFNWIKASGEETPGRASGKAITCFMLITCLIITHFMVIYFVRLFGVDLTLNQVTLISDFYTMCYILIPCLYGIKVVGKSKFMAGSDDDGGSGSAQKDDSAQK